MSLYSKGIRPVEFYEKQEKKNFRKWKTIDLSLSLAYAELLLNRSQFRNYKQLVINKFESFFKNIYR